ncbi:MAG: lytic transglycosylase domain-containing protein [Armatimonadetes bacterium]|nr:lytic transglycosylase domain-containing protein [Armatimonadota bacterium]
MTITPRGLYGSMQRMRELQSRIDSLTPKPRLRQTRKLDDVAPMPTPMAGSFEEILDKGVRPFDPMGAGVARDVARAPSNLLPLIRAAAEKAGIDPLMFEALVGRESGFETGAVSIAGAKGLAQLMPSLARALGVEGDGIFDPAQNLNAGARHLAQLLRDFGGDRELAIAAYSAGPGTVRLVGGIPPESKGYVQDILRQVREIGRQ